MFIKQIFYNKNFCTFYFNLTKELMAFNSFSLDIFMSCSWACRFLDIQERTVMENLLLVNQLAELKQAVN